MRKIFTGSTTNVDARSVCGSKHSCSYLMQLLTFAFLTSPTVQQLSALPLLRCLTDKVFMLMVNFGICSTVTIMVQGLRLRIELVMGFRLGLGFRVRDLRFTDSVRDRYRTGFFPHTIPHKYLQPFLPFTSTVTRQLCILWRCTNPVIFPTTLLLLLLSTVKHTIWIQRQSK